VRDAGKVLKGKVKQYIFISTISVYASNAKPADESDPVQVYVGADPMAEKVSNNSLYGPLKAVSEAEARPPVRGGCCDGDPAWPDRGTRRRDRPLQLLARAPRQSWQ
jgi:hypothetical protein